MNHQKRTQLFVDPSVQSVLLLRAVLYWAFCVFMLTLVMVCWRIITGPSRPVYVHLDYLWFHYKPAAIASTLLLPILVIDMLRVSNRFAGPMVRLRNVMRRLADGEQNIATLRFRKKDFWHDFADDFNRLVQRLNEEERATKESVDVSGTPPADANGLERATETSDSPSADGLVKTKPAEKELVAVASE